MKSPFGDYNITNNVLLRESLCASWLGVKKILAKRENMIFSQRLQEHQGALRNKI